MLRELPRSPRRILIVRLGAIGDVARVLPMLNGLKQRFADTEIDWVVQAKAADLLRDHPQITELFVVPFRGWHEALSAGAWRLRRRIQARRHDLVLDFQGMAKGAVWAVAGGIGAVRVGWGPGHVRNLSWLTYHGVRYPPGKKVNRHIRHRAIVDWLSVPDLPAIPPTVDPDEAADIDRFLDGLGDSPRPWVLGYPGSSVTGSHKRWNPERFQTALRSLRDRVGGTVLIGWGPAEEEAARRFADRIGGARLIPETSIRGLTHLISKCDLFVGMDTGPMHLAGLVGTPVVAVFGRSNPEVHGPATHLRGCTVSGPDARHWPTRKRSGLEPFAGPSPDEVVNAALEMLKQGAGR